MGSGRICTMVKSNWDKEWELINSEILALTRRESEPESNPLLPSREGLRMRAESDHKFYRLFNPRS